MSATMKAYIIILLLEQFFIFRLFHFHIYESMKDIVDELILVCR